MQLIVNDKLKLKNEKSSIKIVWKRWSSHQKIISFLDNCALIYLRVGTFVKGHSGSPSTHDFTLHFFVFILSMLQGVSCIKFKKSTCRNAKAQNCWKQSVWRSACKCWGPEEFQKYKQIFYQSNYRINICDFFRADQDITLDTFPCKTKC